MRDQPPVSAPGGDPGPRIEPLERFSKESVARLLAAAFASNPLNVAVVGGSEKRRYRKNLHGMRSLLAAASEGACGRAATLAAEAPSGVLIGIPPDLYPLPAPPWPMQLRAALGQGLRVVSRWSHVYDRLNERHPVVPHFYLGILGVEPAMQRRGIGGLLLSDWLASVDAQGLPSYLETDRERNVAFYAHAGFEIESELDVLGVRVFCMWRAGQHSK